MSKRYPLFSSSDRKELFINVSTLSDGDENRLISLSTIFSGRPILRPNSMKSSLRIVLTSENSMPSRKSPRFNAKILGIARWMEVFIRSYAGESRYSSPAFISEKFFKCASSFSDMKLNRISWKKRRMSIADALTNFLMTSAHSS